MFTDYRLGLPTWITCTGLTVYWLLFRLITARIISLNLYIRAACAYVRQKTSPTMVYKCAAFGCASGYKRRAKDK